MFERIKDDINGILERDPAARTRWEVLTCYPGLHAIIMHRWAYACWQNNFKWLGRFISQLARWFTGIEIHPAAKIGKRVFIDHGMGVVIGETAEIGDNCTIYQGVTLGGTTLFRGTKRHPTLGKNVIVGANAMVLGGFTVGDGAKIGSAAVVVKEVPAGATAVGNPARILSKEKPQDSEENTPSNATRNVEPHPAEAAENLSAANTGKDTQHSASEQVQQAGQPDCDDVQVQFTAYAVTPGVDPLVLAMKAVADGACSHEQQINLLWDVIEKLAQDKGVTLPEEARQHKMDMAPLEKIKS